ncbi:MAG: outer membrane beta-barrel domain-containing protein [Pseudomonadota bacterium]
MHTSLLRKLVLAAATTTVALSALAADPVPAAKTPTEQVILPAVNRRDIKLPRFPSNDFEVGAFVGTYSTQNFGASTVGGLRLGYHITEDFFAEAVIAQTQVSDANYRLILPGGIFASEKENLSYYNLSVGYNVLPGEVFWGSKNAWPFSLYVIGGVGSTSFNQQRRATFNFGSGLRVYITDSIAVQIDARDHIYSLDILGKNQTTQNLELSFGLTASF